MVPTTTEHTTTTARTTPTDPTTSTRASPEQTSTTTRGTPSTQAEATQAEMPTTLAVPVETEQVNVYWSWMVLNPTAGSVVRIGAGARRVAVDDPVRNSLEAMVDGVTSVEQTIGMGTDVPSGTRVLGLSVDGSTATVDLSADFAMPGELLDETVRLAQVVFTVTQFDGIDRVKFEIDGVASDPILSNDFVIGDGLTRDALAAVRARIMIEEPSPGAEITTPLVIRGESNTFEGTVRYAVVGGGGDGLVLTDGFTTATAGNGRWGTFEVDVDVPTFPPEYQPGPGAIIMWEDSPRDGSRVDLVEIPIVLPER